MARSLVECAAAAPDNAQVGIRSDRGDGKGVPADKRAAGH